MKYQDLLLCITCFPFDDESMKVSIKFLERLLNKNPIEFHCQDIEVIAKCYLSDKWRNEALKVIIDSKCQFLYGISIYEILKLYNGDNYRNEALNIILPKIGKCTSIDEFDWTLALYSSDDDRINFMNNISGKTIYVITQLKMVLPRCITYCNSNECKLIMLNHIKSNISTFDNDSIGIIDSYIKGI